MVETRSREIRLKNRPMGMATENDFELVEVMIPEIEEGQILVRNQYISVDPYMRGRMGERETYIAPFELGKPLDGGCVGQIVDSRSEEFKQGDFVLGNKGWREFFVTESRGVKLIDPEIAPIQNYLGILGMPGFTAYVGLLDIGQPKEGDIVFVSTAAGAVGSLVCQIAKIKGCRVIGSTGSDEKVAWLQEEAGIDVAFNYKTTDNLLDELKKLCPDGIDVYFDNVGGIQLEAAIDSMNNFGRIVLCGMISIYNATRPPRAPRNLILAISKRLTFKGFIVYDQNDRMSSFLHDMGEWLKQGQIQWKETIIHGLENAPKAFLGLFTGESFGKMLVKL
ncbi:MAG: NADP-dependent oxidoreductase [Candidatus Aminicenantes bacterium]|nr:MAG: NADP-dependent oxidoreductase [Candidatus Aminicenantes bacterium]